MVTRVLGVSHVIAYCTKYYTSVSDSQVFCVKKTAILGANAVFLMLANMCGEQTVDGLKLLLFTSIR